MELRKFRTVMILNRGEIACRLIQACQELGIRSVAVFSDADKESRHVDLADAAVGIGGTSPQESYLNLEKLLRAARDEKVDAVHPGYGFLSERAPAAEAFLEAGIQWIGPRPESILLLGDKLEAKKVLRKHDIPTAPWGEVNLGDMPGLRKTAHEIGFPVLLKAASGGGGKGMRLVHNDSELEEAAHTASREASSSFGDATLILEKYLQEPRHVEVQILGDRTGKVIHFGERECSLQRRHQKVIEEAPAHWLSEDTRRAMCDAATRLASAVGYENAGTVEFLVDKHENFYFLEVNSRLQVEHSVTEAVWGVDLVKAQILLAEGLTLKEIFPDRDKMTARGHAIQARIYAEDASRGFAPCPGPLAWVEWPTAVGVRIDTGVRSGSVISLDYDPMVAKMTVQAESRDRAIDRLLWSLRRTVLLGTTTNVNYLQDVLLRSEVHEGKTWVKFLEQKMGDWNDPVPDSLMARHAVLLAQSTVAAQPTGGRARIPSPWETR